MIIQYHLKNMGNKNKKRIKKYIITLVMFMLIARQMGIITQEKLNVRNILINISVNK